MYERSLTNYDLWKRSYFRKADDSEVILQHCYSFCSVSGTAEVQLLSKNHRLNSSVGRKR